MPKINNVITYDSVVDCWKDVLKNVIDNGLKVGNNIELSNLVFSLNSDIEEKFDDLYFKAVKTKKYFERVKTLLLSTKYVKGKGSYYGRMTNSIDGFNQVSEIIDVLQKKPQSKNATIIIIQPGSDHRKARFRGGNMPCIISIDFRIRLGKLKMTVVFRTQDVFNLGYPDYFFLRQFHSNILNQINYEPTLAVKNHAQKFKQKEIIMGETTFFIVSAFINSSLKNYVLEFLK